MLKRIRGALTAAEWARAGGLAAAVIALHVVGFGLLFGVVVPHHFSLGAGGAFTAGVGLTAYTLGMRHAFDADHIAAIDNTTRKFMQEGQRPLSVGFFFALGHSTSRLPASTRSTPNCRDFEARCMRARSTPRPLDATRLH